MSVLKPDQLLAQIRSGKLGGLYLFDGPENFLKQRAVASILKKLLPAEAKEFNLEKFNGSSSPAKDVVSAINSLPFLGEKRVVVVQEADDFKAVDSRLIAEGLAHLPDSTCVLLVFTKKANLRDELTAVANSRGHVVTFWTPFPNQIPMWVINEGKLRGKTIAYDAARVLGEACTDLQEISNELDKLILFVGDKNSIDLSDLEKHGLPEEYGDYRDLEEAIWMRKLPECLSQVTNLTEVGIRAESVFPVFERVFRKLVLARYQLDEKGLGMQELYSRMGLRGKTQQSLLASGLRAYSRIELKDTLQKVIQADFELKTGALSGDLALTFLILNTVGRTKAKVSALG